MQLFDDPAEHGVAGGRDGDGVEAVVGRERGGGVVGRDGPFEVAVGLAHAAEVLLGHDRDGRFHGELVEGAQDGEGVLDVAPVEGGDAGVDARLRFDQADVGEPGERLAHGGAAQTEALGELTVPDLLAGDEFPAHDGVAQAVEDLVTEEAAGDGTVE